MRGSILICDNCRLQRGCDMQHLFARGVLQALAGGEPVDCADYDPDSWHGLEGVSA